MAEPILTMIALAIVLAYPSGSEPLFALRTGRALQIGGMSIPEPILWTATIVLLFAPWSAVFTRPRDRDVSRRRFANRILALVLFAGIVFLFHFPAFVQVGSFYTGSILLALLPYFAMSGISGFLNALKDSETHPDEPFRAQLMFGLKTFGGFSFLPITAILLLIDLFANVEPLARLSYIYPFLAPLGLLGLIFLFALLSPYVLRVLFGAKPIPPTPLRKRLEDLCRRANFRAAEMLVVPSGRLRIANAFIVGLAAPIRYVFFTDYLLRGMKPEEVECVLAHEMAHAKKKHLPSFIYFSIGSLILADLSFQVLTTTFANSIFPMVFLPLLLFAWVSCFSFVSRRFESEADLWGSQMCRDPQIFMNTLARISELNRIPPHVGSLRHFSISERIQMLYAVRLSPMYGTYIYRTAETLRQICFYGFLASALLLLPLLYTQVRFSGTRTTAYGALVEAEAGMSLLEQGRFRDAEAILARTTRMLRENGEEGLLLARAHLFLALARVGAGRLDAARGDLQTAARIGLRHPRDRLLLERLREAAGT